MILNTNNQWRKTYSVKRNLAVEKKKNSATTTSTEIMSTCPQN